MGFGVILILEQWKTLAGSARKLFILCYLVFKRQLMEVKKTPQLDPTCTAVCTEPHSPREIRHCSRSSPLKQEDPSPSAGSKPVNGPVLAGHLPHALQAVDENAITVFWPT